MQAAKRGKRGASSASLGGGRSGLLAKLHSSVADTPPQSRREVALALCDLLAEAGEKLLEEPC